MVFQRFLFPRCQQLPVARLQSSSVHSFARKASSRLWTSTSKLSNLSSCHITRRATLRQLLARYDAASEQVCVKAIVDLQKVYLPWGQARSVSTSAHPTEYPPRNRRSTR